MTGTPLQNNLEEYHHIIDIIQKNFLGDIQTFRDYFGHPINEGLAKERFCCVAPSNTISEY